MSKDRAVCRNGWASGSTRCCSSWRSFHTGDTWRGVPACLCLRLVSCCSRPDTEVDFQDGTGLRGETLVTRRRNIVLQPAPDDWRLLHLPVTGYHIIGLNWPNHNGPSLKFVCIYTHKLIKEKRILLEKCQMKDHLNKSANQHTGRIFSAWTLGS